MINIACPMLGDEEVDAVREVLLSGMLAQGEKVAEFERLFAEYVGTKYAVAVSNGTHALHLAMLASGISEGHEVITTPFSFVSTATSILFCRARPVFADIDPATFNISPDEIRKKITPKTKAIMPVHLFGLPADMKAINEIAVEHDLVVIEDACQSHGASINGKKTGTFGDCAAFSFYPTKNMTTGEGGMITTDNDEIAQKVKKLRNHGQRDRYDYEFVGYNYRMTNIAAAIGIVQLGKLEKMTNKRIQNARFLNEHLQDIVTTPFVPDGYRHVYHQYTIKSKERDSLIERLKDYGVSTGVYYPKALHQFDILAQYGSEDLKHSETVSHEVLSLPVHPALTQDNLETIARCF